MKNIKFGTHRDECFSRRVVVEVQQCEGDFPH
jgi:hypothetical protein